MPLVGTQVEPDPFGADLPNKFDPDHRTRSPAGNDVSDPIRSPGALLLDTVARLQLDMEELRSESMCTQMQRYRQGTFMYNKVPKFAGVTSWEQYRQVFDAIVLSNGWDDATAALQLLSHSQGGVLNMALLVPEAGLTGWGTYSALQVAGSTGGLSPPV